METASFKRRVPASALFVGALALSAVAHGCGGREPSMASRSAAAYQEAVATGSSIGSGHGGHGEGGNTDHSGMTTPEGSAKPDHGAGGGAGEHSEHSPAKAPDSMAGMDHSEPVGGAAPMAGMDHSKPGSPSGEGPMAGMDHSEPVRGKPKPSAGMTGMDHPRPVAGAADPMAGMDHGAMGHGDPTATPPSVPPPTSSSEIGRLNPSKTLVQDEFDQLVAPLPIGGTATGGTGIGHDGHGAQPAAPGVVAGTPKAGLTAAPAKAAFTCPMHPEVVRSQPGTCPKCGMTLVKKEKP